ncbi:MAG TPA: hypothetical protein VKY57_17180 [Chitinispirillaceae bacterium]|nr:hypothetical protein [Chitinispirillaceae bacterium]
MSCTKNLLLPDLTSAFSKTAVICVKDFLGKPAVIHENWDVVDRLVTHYDYILTMGGASQNFQSILAIGVSKDFSYIFGVKDKTEFIDILGEFANTYWALLMDDHVFTKHFGILNQSIPVVYSNGTPFLPFISGVQGKVYIENEFIFLGYAIQKVIRYSL